MKQIVSQNILFLFLISCIFFSPVIVCSQEAPADSQGAQGWKDLVKTSWDLYYQGKNKEAIEVARKGVALVEKEFGLNHPNRTLPLKNLADIYNVVGEHAKAEKIYKDVITTIETLMGKDHPLVANFINNLATFYYYQEKYEKAETLFLKALEMYRHNLGLDHTEVVTALDNLAVFYESKNEPGKAERYKKEAQEIEMRRSEEYHTGTPVRFPQRENNRHFVFDDSNLITEEVKKKINKIGVALQARRTISLFVVVVESLSSYGAIAWTPEIYSANLLAEWRWKENENEEALLLFISSTDHAVHIETSKKLDLSAISKLETIKEDIILKHFREERFADGILAGVQALERFSLMLDDL